MTPASVLVVEDEGLIALQLMELLSKAGYHVPDAVASGEEALEVLGRTTTPDLILMDIGLPGGMDGIETARRIREKIDIPVIFITAYTNERILSRMEGLSSVSYLVKPFPDLDLLSGIETALSQKKENEISRPVFG